VSKTEKRGNAVEKEQRAREKMASVVRGWTDHLSRHQGDIHHRADSLLNPTEQNAFLASLPLHADNAVFDYQMPPAEGMQPYFEPQAVADSFAAFDLPRARLSEETQVATAGVSGQFNQLINQFRLRVLLGRADIGIEVESGFVREETLLYRQLVHFVAQEIRTLDEIVQRKMFALLVGFVQTAYIQEANIKNRQIPGIEDQILGYCTQVFLSHPELAAVPVYLHDQKRLLRFPEQFPLTPAHIRSVLEFRLGTDVPIEVNEGFEVEGKLDRDYSDEQRALLQQALLAMGGHVEFDGEIDTHYIWFRRDASVIERLMAKLGGVIVEEVDDQQRRMEYIRFDKIPSFLRRALVRLGGKIKEEDDGAEYIRFKRGEGFVKTRGGATMRMQKMIPSNGEPAYREIGFKGEDVNGDLPVEGRTKDKREVNIVIHDPQLPPPAKRRKDQVAARTVTRVELLEILDGEFGGIVREKEEFKKQRRIIASPRNPNGSGTKVTFDIVNGISYMEFEGTGETLEEAREALQQLLTQFNMFIAQYHQQYQDIAPITIADLSGENTRQIVKRKKPAEAAQ